MRQFYSQFKNVKISDVKFVTKDPLEDLKKKQPVGYGCIYPRIMFVGYAPSQYEVQQQRYFCDKPNSKLEGIVAYLSKSVGVLYNSLYKTNLIYTNEEITSEEYKKCFENLTNEISTVRPKNIILLGEKISSAILRAPFTSLRLKKNKKIFGDYEYNVFVVQDLRKLYFDHTKTVALMKEELDAITKFI